MPDRARSRALVKMSREQVAGRAAVWGLTDTGLILLFAATGRQTHEHGISASGILATAWPFLVAYTVTAVVVRAWRSPAALWPTTVVLWIGVAIGGLVLRFVTGAGVALSFQVVTLLALGVLLTLPRSIAHARDPRRRHEPVA